MKVQFEESSMIGTINEGVQGCMTIAKVKVDKIGGYINVSQQPSIGDNLRCIIEYRIHHQCIVLSFWAGHIISYYIYGT